MIRDLVIIAIALVAALASCKKEEVKEVSRTQYNGGVLSSVEHDGHMFIVELYQQKGFILHHPDCICERVAK